ncbi:duf636 domain protein [Phlyctema vagabunda]|uniref:Duf636 domain protein n=1 Tax=Phlyctema vagabunda TaxID=108571 RepID=A0ABR4PYQ4_9HELO
MSTGRCLCGAIKIVVTGKPVAVGICHCLDCRKTSGSSHALNWFVPDGQLQITGTPKTYTNTSDLGNPIKNSFCSTCGTTLFREGSAAPGIKFVKAGVFDDPDVISSFKPQGEIYVSRRATWMMPVEGASQKQKMMS